MTGGRSLALIVLLLLSSAATTARAQDLDEVEAEPAVNNGFELHENNFESWIYGNVTNGESGRDRLESLLALHLVQVEQSCSLSEAQKKKLMMAGRGDLKHFLDRVAEARKVFELLRRDQNRMGEINQETQPLAATFNAGLFSQDSLFGKTLGTTLNTEQANHYQESIRERNRYRYRAKVRLAIANLDNSIGLTADQRQKLIDLILAETRPLEKAIPVSQYESYVILLKVSKIPEAKVRSILDDARWKEFNQQLEQAKAMEPFLRSNGYLDEPAPEPAATSKPVENKVDQIKKN